MVSVQAEFSAVIADSTLCPHGKRLPASVAELVLALGASEVHATAFREGVAEFAFWTVYAVVG